MVLGVCVLMQKIVLEIVLVTGLPDGRRTARLCMYGGLESCSVSRVSLTERNGLVVAPEMCVDVSCSYGAPCALLQSFVPKGEPNDAGHCPGVGR
jgi:hypothetical protein